MIHAVEATAAELAEQKIQFKQAVSKLKSALAEQESELERDGCIQRFEFCVDLMWKTLKTFLSIRHGIVCNSPKSCVREAFGAEVIPEDNPLWLKMLDMRNLTVHTYKEQLAKEIFDQLPATVGLFELLLAQLSEESKH